MYAAAATDGEKCRVLISNIKTDGADVLLEANAEGAIGIYLTDSENDFAFRECSDGSFFLPPNSFALAEFSVKK